MSFAPQHARTVHRRINGSGPGRPPPGHGTVPDPGSAEELRTKVREALDAARESPQALVAVS